MVVNGQKYYYARSSESGLSEVEAASEITERFVGLHKFANMKAENLRFFDALRSTYRNCNSYSSQTPHSSRKVNGDDQQKTKSLNPS